MEQDFSLSPWAERPTSFLTRVRSIGEDLLIASVGIARAITKTPIASVGIARAITKKARSGDDP
jgi:hypothetical protein